MVYHCRRKQYLSYSRKQQADTQSSAPVFVLDNGLFEMTARLGNVVIAVNAVYAAHKHIQVLSAAIAGANKIVV